ncbi:hypothetical protein ACVW1A_004963 [Bradyrhizobium sp. LB1.3]
MPLRKSDRLAIEIEGGQKPACVAELIALTIDKCVQSMIL